MLVLYAGLQYGQVFGRVGVLSPALWFNSRVLKLAEQHDGYKSRFYLSGCQKESRTMGRHIQQIAERLQPSGFAGDPPARKFAGTRPAWRGLVAPGIPGAVSPLKDQCAIALSMLRSLEMGLLLPARHCRSAIWRL